jgi:hypothetical protein
LSGELAVAVRARIDLWFPDRVGGSLLASLAEALRATASVSSIVSTLMSRVRTDSLHQLVLDQPSATQRLLRRRFTSPLLAGERRRVSLDNARLGRLIVVYLTAPSHQRPTATPVARAYRRWW